MLGSHDEAGSPRPLTKMMSLDRWMEAGRKVWDMGAFGLLGIVRYAG